MEHICTPCCALYPLVQIHYFKGKWGKWAYSGVADLTAHSNETIKEAIDRCFGELPIAPGITCTWEEAKREFHIVVLEGPFPVMFIPEVRFEAILAEVHERKDRKDVHILYKVKEVMNQKYADYPEQNKLMMVVHDILGQPVVYKLIAACWSIMEFKELQDEVRVLFKKFEAEAKEPKAPEGK